MSIAEMIRRMSEAGAPPEAIAIAVEAIEYVQANDVERRAKQAERKRRSRDKGVTVTGQSQDSHGTNGSYLEVREEETSPIREEAKEVRKKVSKKEPRKTKHRLPSDWEPSESLLAYGREQGLSAAQVSKTVENLRIWAKSTGETKADWDATLQGFFRRDAEKFGSAPSLSLVMPEHGNQHAGRVYLRRETPQFEAWTAHTGKAVTDKHGGWWFDSEWPSERRMASS